VMGGASISMERGGRRSRRQAAGGCAASRGERTNLEKERGVYPRTPGIIRVVPPEKRRT